MIYKINNKYYINISPMMFSEVNIVKENGDFVVKPVGNRIEINKSTETEMVDIKVEGEKLFKSVKPAEDEVTYRPNKYNRRK